MKTPARRASIRGFTLIELLIVIVIIVALSGAAAPVFLSNSDSVKLKASARRLGDLMRYCNGAAVFEGTTFRLHFSLEEAKCQVTFEKDPIEAPGLFEPYMASSFSSFKLHDGVLFNELLVQDVSSLDEEEPEEETEEMAAEEDELYIEFRPDGTTDDAIVVLTNRREEFYSIVLGAYTAAVQVYPENLGTIVEQDESEDASSGSEESNDKGLLDAGSGYE